MKTQEGYKIWKDGKKLKGLSKVKCKCGRKVIVERKNGSPITRNVICGVCKTIGLEKSREEYLILTRVLNKKTKLNILDGKEDKGYKKKRLFDYNG